MKKCFLFALLLSLSFSAFSSDVKCYSEGNLFYHKKVKDLFIGEGFIINRDNGFDEVVMANCIVRYKHGTYKVK